MDGDVLSLKTLPGAILSLQIAEIAPITRSEMDR
jgi:hypothetical protein